jgi:hypothetical protein
MSVKKYTNLSILNYLLIAFIGVVVSACSDGTASVSGDQSGADRHSYDSSVEFSIREAEWDSVNSRLKVTGYGERRKEVTITNADTGAELGTVTSKKSEWKFTKYNIDNIPCRVKATQRGSTDDMAVKYAPSDCNNGGGNGGGGSGGGTGGGGGNGGAVSINSTSQNGMTRVVMEQAFTGQDGYAIFGSNDLGMHCGDLDTRISSILPPFNTVHSQVVQRGLSPNILSPLDDIEVVYSAASNPNDPIISGINSAGSGPVASSVLPDGSVYKTNFWDVANEAYGPFYPEGILNAFYSSQSDQNIDLGLPMPNVEELYKNGNLTAEQQEMPARDGFAQLNDPLAFKFFVSEQVFFTSFPFGYTKQEANWFEAAGIPMTAYDDYGRENPWPLIRLQAKSKSGGQVLASLDTVLPISGEANCGACHNGPNDLNDASGIATQNLTKVTYSVEDDANVPLDVSLEWAADINILRLHDQKHNTNLIVGTTQDGNGGTLPFKAVVCQSCHYTPALDLAQLGPQGPENDGPLALNNMTLTGVANGRDQIKHKSMSNVMHQHHGTVDINGKSPGDAGYDAANLMFPAMPAPVNPDGSFRDPVAAKAVLDETCYQCHPGRRTDCLRGAMANGGMLCQDCHGDMQQIGSDFTNNVQPIASADGTKGPGMFHLGNDFYTNSDTPRVPWANEPGCGSCHTGDAMDNMHGTPDTIGDPEDGIRLMQAYLDGDAKATPIVPTNKRFAENVVDAGPATGNPMLYRVSTDDHAGIFCEACHGATHGIWPNKNPDANDNVAAVQLQGHTGPVAECSVCHEGDLGNTLNGPHGMHPVGDTSFSNGGHEDMVEHNSAMKDACRACHGRNGEGSVLARAATDRVLRSEHGTVTLNRGDQVTCDLCHENELASYSN